MTSGLGMVFKLLIQMHFIFVVCQYLVFFPISCEWTLSSGGNPR